MNADIRMTRDQFVKTRWKAYDRIDFSMDRKNTVVECMLLAVDFDNGLMKLEPFDKEEYEDNSFWTRFDYCKRSRPKLKVT